MLGLPQRLKQLMLASQRRIAVAESLTAGHLQALIAEARGASQYYEGGIIAYSLEQKVNLLGVERTHAAEMDCVSAEVARQMAIGVRQLFGTTIGVGITGYAEPDGLRQVDQPFAWFALDIAGTLHDGRIEAPGMERIAVQRHVARQVLQQLVEKLEDALQDA